MAGRSFLVSLELLEGRVEKGSYFSPFHSRLGDKGILMVEQRHKNCFGIYISYAKCVIIIL